MSSKSVVATLPRTALIRAPRTGDRHIAIVEPSYGLERVSYMIAPPGYDYVRLPHLPMRRLDRGNHFFEETPILFGARVDLVHSFNHIVANRPFVVSAEMELPRYWGAPRPWQQRFAMGRLNAADCRGIWPLSDAAGRYLTRRFRAAGQDALVNKIALFRGGVSPVPAGAERTGYAETGPLTLLFVGGGGLRKGLGPTLEAAARLRAGGIDVRVTVVGKPQASTYALRGATVPTAPVEALLAEPWVDHHATMPNADVRRAMGAHDIFILPTADESLGWVVAEAGMSGTPVITTDIFALPEMVNDGATGWTIPLPQDEDGRWIHLGGRDRAAWDAMQAHLTDNIVRILETVAADRSIVARYGRAAHAHISALYGMDVAARRLGELYAGAIAAR